MPKSIALSLIGVGHVATYQMRAIAELPSIELVGACDKDPTTRRTLPDGVPFYDDPDRFIASIKSDVTLVSVPNSQHHPIARALLEAGHNVLLEKPATTVRHELDELCELAERKGCFFAVAFHARFGLDVLWFLRERDEGTLGEKLGPVTGFHCGYYDPYFANGELLPAARSLGGSWTDSGINALSVVDLLVPPECLQFDHACLTISAGVPCTELQGTAYFRFDGPNAPRRARGLIDTNWTLDLNCKTTRLDFAETGHEILLHHSHERVLLRDPAGAVQVIAEQATGRPRLVNHYIGVFLDLQHRFRAGRSNMDVARRVHNLLFSAYEQPNGPSPCR